MLKLEVGKTYVTADGTPVKIVSEDNHPDFPFDGSNGDSYAPDGRWAKMGAHEANLVAELQEPGAVPAPDVDAVEQDETGPSGYTHTRQYFLDGLMMALIANRASDTPAEIADAFLALADARAKR